MEGAIHPFRTGTRGMTYEEALAFWYGRIDYEHKTPKSGDFTLDRMRALLRQLGDPHDRLRIVHVASSKGKGSTSAMLASILRQAGYRSGLFTSPHLVRVEERVQVDGAPVSRQELAALLDDVRRAVEAGNLEPTFFEVATAVGFSHFVRRRADIAVIEVGLGGRLDSTNVCHPVASVITSISFDHTQMLGTELANIAGEKAGIVKPGVPVVSGATVPEAREVIERICRERGAPLKQLGVDFGYEYKPGVVDQIASTPPTVRVLSSLRSLGDGISSACPLGLLGEHQAANAAVAVTVIEHLRLRGFHVGEEAVRGGLATVKWPARMEVMGRHPLVVLDCAHNVASATALVKTLKTSFSETRRWLVFACSSDKDLAGIFRVLVPHFQHVFLTTYAGSARATPPGRLAEILRSVSDVPATMFASAADAWHAAHGKASPDQLICITGSVFLAGELRPLLLGS
ncbi:MAG TPA: folylpolyglutamate synthase/dihydrofolate synthase family protein [Gemmataceae bacterium]|nr:folylpolyglutamate synthase/dihydrofolate synthase family protein [Gemmataceae bacterium]